MGRHSNPPTPSTQQNITREIPACNGAAKVAGRYLRYPDQTGKRIAEGGMRLRGLFKRSLPGLPLVSVVTVCFNSVRTLEQCIQSVLGQAYANIEYILIDAGSSDGTLDVIKRHEDAIDYYVSEPDRGLYHAMNKGLELSSGDYILILNSDDWYESDCISSLVRGIRASGTDFCSALARRVADDGSAIDVLPSMPYDDSLRFGMSLRHELMLVPSAIYERVGGYDSRYRIIADFDFAVRLYEAGCTLHEIQRPLLNFRVSGVSNTNWSRLVQEHRMLLQRQFPTLGAQLFDVLADPRAYTADRVDDALLACPALPDFQQALVAYGWRRKLYSSARSPHGAVTYSPVVSVIIPCFNATATIDRCLDSVCAQSLGDLEILCVDDASTDETRAAIERRASGDGRIRLLANERNLGVAASRNRALCCAGGEFVFFLDSDDELTPGALERLVEAAQPLHSELVKGRYEKVSGRNVHATKAPPANLPPSVDLRECPDLLANTEGFWSYLYRRSFIRNARFLEHLRVGEDSLFLISALVRARRVTWIPDVVYRYHQHAASAMRNFDTSKYLDAIDWRERAFRIFADYGHESLGRWYALDYWSPAFFSEIRNDLPAKDRERVEDRLRGLLKAAGYQPGDRKDSRGALFDALAANVGGMPDGKVTDGAKPLEPVVPLPHGAGRTDLILRLRVGVFSTTDKGGAAIGSIRRVEMLRAQGVNATLHTVVTERAADYSRPLIPREQQAAAWRRLKRIAMDHVTTLPGFRGRELFSMPRSVIDATKLAKLFAELDVIHLHWVVGMLDHTNFGRVICGKPVVWTLADMSAFTGGCHYSEGCEEYQRECRSCHLLPQGSAIAHENWKIKRNAYARIDNLQIICPSRWMAERVSRSSLLGDRKINFIPNAFPVDNIFPVNKIVARLELGLPLDKKLIVFGADSVVSKRKGGDVLNRALAILAASEQNSSHTHVIVFGHHKQSLPLPTHDLGFIRDEEKLRLAYSAADVYAFPSREDNAPLTVAESLLCGTPVVAFPVGNVPELLTHRVNGYIASPGDVQDFAAGLIWALNASKDMRSLIAMVQRCRETARRHHDPLTAVNRHLAVYRDAIKRR